MIIYRNLSKNLTKHSTILAVIVLLGFGNAVYADCTPSSCPKGQVCRIMGTDGKKSCQDAPTKFKLKELKKEGMEPDYNPEGNDRPRR